MLPARKIVFIALYTALVTVVTASFAINVPATKGYFNIGESAVYLVALLGGPYIGAFAGGVGSMLSDILLGYLFYAPGTLVIKAVEGGVLGFLATRKPRLSRRRWLLLSVVVAGVLFTSIYLLGVSYIIGDTQISLGFFDQQGMPLQYSVFGLIVTLGATLNMDITPIFWVVIGGLVALFVISTSFFARSEVGWLVMSAAASGFFMVLGYFLYEVFIIQVAAIAEVPTNIGQVIIGIIIAVPAFKSLKSLQRTKT